MNHRRNCCQYVRKAQSALEREEQALAGLFRSGWMTETEHKEMLRHLFHCHETDRKHYGTAATDEVRARGAAKFELLLRSHNEQVGHLIDVEAIALFHLGPLTTRVWQRPDGKKSAARKSDGKESEPGATASCDTTGPDRPDDIT